MHRKHDSSNYPTKFPLQYFRNTGEDFSFMLPKGLDLSGTRGDELLSMLEAIGNEGRQLRQELDEAKAREDFLTKKVKKELA